MRTKTRTGIQSCERPRHPSAELKLSAIKACFEEGNDVQLISAKIGYSRAGIYAWRKRYLKEGMAVYIGNFFEDAIDELEVKLGGKYDEVKFINCKGRLSGNKVIIDNIPPYASVGFSVGKG